MIRYYTICSFAIILILAIGLKQDVYADNRKDKIQATFLYNFLKYVSWPSSTFPNPDAAANICIYNNKSLEDALQYIATQKATERKIIITSLTSSDKPTKCHIVFISANGDVPQYFKQFSSQPTGLLLVSDIPGLIQKGGMIGIIEEKEYLALEINNTALTRAGLQASSKLLHIAKRVI